MKLEESNRERILSMSPSNEDDALEIVRRLIGIGCYKRARDMLRSVRKNRAAADYFAIVLDILEGGKENVAIEKLKQTNSLPCRLLYWTSCGGSMPTGEADNLNHEFSKQADTKLWADYCSCFRRLRKLQATVKDELVHRIKTDSCTVRELYNDQKLTERESQVEKIRKLCEQRIEEHRTKSWK